MSRSALLPPQYIKGETENSFKARVKTWERVTGKKYPRSFSGKNTVEERLLGGETFLRGLDNYTSYASEDDLREYERDISLAKANDPTYKKAAAEARAHAQDEKKWADFTELAERAKWGGGIKNFDKLLPGDMEIVNLELEKTRQAEAKEAAQVSTDVKPKEVVQPEVGAEVPNTTTTTTTAKEETKPSYGWSTVFHTTDAHGNPQVLTGNQRTKWEEENQHLKDVPVEDLLGTWGR